MSDLQASLKVEPPVNDDVLKAEVKDAVPNAAGDTKAEVEAPVQDPRNNNEYEFDIEFRDARGKFWSGKFKNKILTIHERQLVGTLRSRFAGGQPIESLDGLTIEINLMVAHLIYSLADKPQWAENLRTLEDPAIIQAIYAEVSSHEAYFLGWRDTEVKSEAKS